MPTTECRKVLKACLAQFVLADVCGNPITGAESAKLTTKGFISVAATAQIENGQEFLQRNACGELDIAERDDDQFKWYDLEIMLFQIDPEGFTLMTDGARALTDADDNVKGFANGKSTTIVHYSLELWTKVVGAGCDAEGNPDWFYFAFPHVANGQLTDFKFEDAVLNMTVKAHTRDAGPNWGVGPSSVLDPGSPAITTDHLVGFVTDVQPPDPVCGLQTV
jgi:hypothetical protein